MNFRDTFDDPVVMAIRRPLNESLVFPATPEMAEKWIEVNRKLVSFMSCVIHAWCRFCLFLFLFLYIYVFPSIIFLLFLKST